MERDSLPSLSREDLENLVIDLQNKIEEMTTPPPNDWHSLFYALLMIVTHKFKSVKVEREVVLGAQPPRADFIVIEENAIVDMGLKIFSIFRKYNILEFKNPADDLSEAVLWNVIGYAGFYISKFQVSADNVTLTLFRGAKPVKLFHDMQDFIVPDETKGIYHIKDWKIGFPIQIIVTTELEGKEYAGFRAISKKPRQEDVKQILSEVLSEQDSDIVGWYRDYLELFSKLDNEIIEDVKRRYPEMARTWRDIFGVDDEINSAVATAVATAVNNNTRTNLFTYVQNGDMSLPNAARNAGMSIPEFEENMRNAGFTVPQSTLV